MSPQAAAIFLYRRTGSRETSKLFGKLIFGPITFNSNDRAGLLLSFDYQPAETDQDRWLRLDFRVSSQQTPPRRYGFAGLNWMGRALLPGQADTMEVGWMLLPEDIERIELDHGAGSGPRAPWTFRVDVEGLVSGPAGVIAIDGQGTLTVAASDWENLVQQMSYGLGSGFHPELSQASLDHPSWLEAEKRLAGARNHLRAGEGRAALGECLGQFETLAGKSYLQDSWKARWSLPVQKRDGVVSALAGHCTYLNKIGHHRDAGVDPATLEHKEMPLDQWEAELVVAASHLYLAYVLRLDSLAPLATENATPEVRASSTPTRA